MTRTLASLLLAASLIGCSSSETPSDKGASPEQATAAGFSAEALKSDLEALYAGLQAGHVNLYANKTKAEYDALYDQMAGSIPASSDEADAFKLFQKFTAFGDVAHATVNIPEALFQPLMTDEARAFPIYPRFVDGQFYIGEDYSGQDMLVPGDRVTGLNGRPIETWLDEVRQFIAADSEYIANSLLEFRFPHYLWLAAGEVETFELDIVRLDGTSATVSIPALTRSERAENIPADDDAARPERHFELMENDTGYLRPGPFYNFADPSNLWDNTSFTAFIDDAFETFIAEGVETLIIDLRQNPGGDSSFSDHMLAWVTDEPFAFASEFIVRSSAAAEAGNDARRALNPDRSNPISDAYTRLYEETPYGETFSLDLPTVAPRVGVRFEGQVYALINRNSYSQAVNVAASIQDYGIGILVGEPTADYATTYGSVETFTLPETGFVVNFPKAHIIRPSGDRVPGGVVPDILVAREIVEGDEDAALEAVLELIRSQ